MAEAENDGNTPKKFVPIGPGNHDRAWNDPPMFATEFNVTGKTPANKLNKRVAYPISPASGPSPSFTSSPLGPPSAGPLLMSSQPPQSAGPAQFQPPPIMFPVGVGIPNGTSTATPTLTAFQPGDQPLLLPCSIPLLDNSPDQKVPFSG